MNTFRIVLIVLSILFACFVHAEEAAVSLSAHNQPLESVLERIANASGVNVVLADKKWAQVPVSLSVKKAELGAALDSVLRAYNYALEWYAEENGLSKVIVRIHEQKDFGESEVYKVDGRPVSDLSAPPLTGQELTNFMAEEIAWRQKTGYKDPEATPEQLEGAATMQDMVDRIGNTKNNKE